MIINIDANSLEEAGFDKYLNIDFMGEGSGYSSRFVRASSLAGGEIGGQVIDLGSGRIKLDGKNKRIIINDGADDRVLIGYDRAGF